MKKEWVQIAIALAVMLTAGAVIRVAENPTALGSLGEWVSGLGAILAAIVALWIADEQRRQANEQFAEERRHATEMANDERRYQEALARAERKRIEDDLRKADYKTGLWFIRSAKEGIRTVVHFSDIVIESPDSVKEYVAFILSSRDVKFFSTLVSGLGPSVFNDINLQSLSALFTNVWNVHLSALDALAEMEGLDDEQIRMMIDYSSLKSNINTLVAAVISVGPESSKNVPSVNAGGWSTFIFPDS